MSKTDTSAAAVERLADVLANSYPYGGPTRTEIEEAAATLCALLGARDAALAQAERWDTEAAASKGTIARLEAERDEAIATLTLYRAQHGCTRGQRTTQWCGEASKVRRAWLRVIQAENQCPATGGGCLANRCGCVAEMEVLMREDDEPSRRSPAMTDPQPPGGWPDAARETVEWALAVHFSGDRMPHMSGDPRNRLSPGRRRQMEDARDAVLEALTPVLAAREAAARREGIEAAIEIVERVISRWSIAASDECAAELRALLEDGR